MRSAIGLGVLSLSVLAGCRDRCGVAVRLAEDDAHSAELSWSDRDSTVLDVTYSSPGDPLERRAAITTGGGQQSTTLWGLPEDEVISYSLEASGQACSDTFRSAGLPKGLPSLSVSTWDAERADAWRYVVGVAMGEDGALFIIDREGRWRFHHLHDQAITVSAALLDGATLLYNSFDQGRANDIGQIHARDLLSGETVDTRTEGGHHTFALLPDGTLAFPSVDVRPWTDPDTGEELQVIGDRVLEIAPDGVVSELWSIWDHEVPAVHDSWDSGFYGELGNDWTHANALTYSVERDSYLLSLGHLDMIYELDRSGAVRTRWTADDVVSGASFNFQHDPTWTDDGTLTLLSYPDDGPPIAIEYAAADDGTLEEVWSYQRDADGISLLGQVRRLPSGNTFVNFGGMGEMREVTPEGEVVWQVNTDLGVWFGNVALMDTLPDLP